MFTKKDYLRYFQEIRKIEASMVKTVTELEKGLEKDSVFKKLEIIKADEIKHEKIVEEILKLIV